MQPPPLRQRESQRNTQTSPPNAGLGVDPAQLKHLLLLCCFSLCLYLCVCFVKSSCCSVTKLCPTLCDPMDNSTPGLPVPPHVSEFVQVHVHWIGDAIHQWNQKALANTSPGFIQLTGFLGSSPLQVPESKAGTEASLDWDRLSKGRPACLWT